MPKIPPKFPEYSDDLLRLINGDCRKVLATLPANSFTAVVTDPPYGLSKQPDIAEVLTHWLNGDDYKSTGGGFMGKEWDSFVPGPATWREVYRVLKPGGHALVFAGTRTQDLMGISLRLAGFHVRDCVAWVYGSGFPKSLDVSKAVDDNLGAEREKVKHFNPRNPKATGSGRDGTVGATRPWIEKAMELGYHEKDGDDPVTDASKLWDGYGTALKPALEPILLCRKPLEGTVADNVLKYGCGALNIDESRIDFVSDADKSGWQWGGAGKANTGNSWKNTSKVIEQREASGRFPANFIHDGSEECVELFPEAGGGKASGYNFESSNNDNPTHVTHNIKSGVHFGDKGSAARFFYSAKSSKSDRGYDNRHATVKPIRLMKYLLRLIKQPQVNLILDPFAGSGSTLVACRKLKLNAVGIELEHESFETAVKRTRLLVIPEKIPEEFTEPATFGKDV